MDKKILSKIFIILFVFIFLILNFSFSKAAFTEDFNNMLYPDGISPSTNNYDIQDNKTRYVCNKVLVKYNGNNNYYIINFIRASYDNTKRLYLNSNNVVCMEDALYMQCLKWTGSTWSYSCWSGFGSANASNISGEPSYISISTNSEIINSSKDIYSNSSFTNVSYKAKYIFTNPSFITTQEELKKGNFDILKIDAGSLDYSSSEGKFLLNIYSGIQISDNLYNYYIKKSILLEYSSNYMYQNNLDLYYYIPRDKLGLDFSNGQSYMFELKEKGGDTIYNSIKFIVTGMTSEEEKKNYDDLTHEKMDEQTSAIKENTETNKGILSSIGNLISYINPFSENFFVYKLIELLGNLLKSLFVPSSEFMSNWFTDISNYFEEAFGILYFPIDLVIQVLGRFNGITGQEPIITFGNLELFGVTLIPAFTYNFNNILTTSAFKTVHDFYLITIDVILWLGLLVYCKNVCANIFRWQIY